MKTINIAVVVAIASIAPAITTTVSATPIRAHLYAQATNITSVNGGTSVFINNDWKVKIGKSGNGYTYSSYQNGTPGIALAGGRLNRSGGKHYYTWNNSGTIYQVTWQPQDPNYARVRVLERGREIFNKLMWTPPEI